MLVLNGLGSWVFETTFNNCFSNIAMICSLFVVEIGVRWQKQQANDLVNCYGISVITNENGYIVITIWSFPHSWLITRFLTTVTQWVPLVEQELLLFQRTSDHVAKSLVFCIVFCRSLFSLYYFSCGHCIVYPSLIYSFWLPLWYLQTLPAHINLFTENH